MIIALAVWLLATVLIGYAAVVAIWPAAPRWRSAEGLLRGALAVGLGFGLSSTALFLAIACVGPARIVGPGTDLVLLLLLAWLARARVRANRHQHSRISAAPHPERLDRWIGWVMIALAGAALLATGAFGLKKPHGDWDGWGIYNLTARFIYLGGNAWRHAFTRGLGIHPDYPLLLPDSAVRGWLYVGHASYLVPVIVSGLFAYAAIGVLLGAVWLLRGRRHGALAAVVALGTPYFISSSMSQYADLPLAFFLIGAIVFVALADRLEDNASWLLAASGLCAGLAAWTKNEGLLFILIYLAGLFVIHRRFLRDRSDRRALVAVFAGLIPMLLVIAYFKVALAPPNDLVSGQGTGTMIRVRDLHRYWTIMKTSIIALPAFPIVPVALFLAIVGIDRNAGDRRATGLALWAVVALAAGYFAVYVVTPLYLQSQLNRSFNRLVLQLWPLLLFAVFMWARVPEQQATVPADS